MAITAEILNVQCRLITDRYRGDKWLMKKTLYPDAFESDRRRFISFDCIPTVDDDFLPTSLAQYLQQQTAAENESVFVISQVELFPICSLLELSSFRVA